eukprot:GHVT01101199.1.p1 GENE.GHVT01101199.1~~GHVT01101199.1.p1  ORF type:complete len:247 (+),score=53.03 GHVT01101199.1:770-1510(+)
MSRRPASLLPPKAQAENILPSKLLRLLSRHPFTVSYALQHPQDVTPRPAVADALSFTASSAPTLASSSSPSALTSPLPPASSPPLPAPVTASAHSKLLLTVWRALYWTVFVLCWFVYPLLNEFNKSGDFTTAGRLKHSLRKNAVYYSSCAMLALAFFIFLFINQDVSVGSLLGLLVGLSNLWGLFLITLLLSYGLVALPRKILRLVRIERELQNRSAPILRRQRHCAAAANSSLAARALSSRMVGL